MSKPIKRKVFNEILRKIKDEVKVHPEQERDPDRFKKILFFHLATMFGRKDKRLELRVVRTHLIRMFGNSEEGQKQFTSEFEEYIKEMEETVEAMKRANESLVKEKSE